MPTKTKRYPNKIKYPERMLKLADALMADASNRKGMKFDLSQWGEVDQDETPGPSCNTVGCAMGYAAVSGMFKRQGLSYEATYGVINITLKGVEGGFSAAQALFGISGKDAGYLFGHTGDIPTTVGAAGERAVAKRLRDYVSGKIPGPTYAEEHFLKPYGYR